MPKSLFVRTLPKPSRRQILDLYGQGLTSREVANRLQISEPWARRVKQQHREEGISRNADGRPPGNPCGPASNRRSPTSPI